MISAEVDAGNAGVPYDTANYAPTSNVI